MISQLLSSDWSVTTEAFIKTHLRIDCLKETNAPANSRAAQSKKTTATRKYAGACAASERNFPAVAPQECEALHCARNRFGGVSEKLIPQQAGLVRRAKTSCRNVAVSPGVLWWQIRCLQGRRSAQNAAGRGLNRKTRIGRCPCCFVGLEEIRVKRKDPSGHYLNMFNAG